MQTFLPFPDFKRSARALDQRRLGAQRVEALQVFNALTVPGHGYRHHPAARMWRGYEEGLLRYALTMAEEWQRRGFDDTVAANIAFGRASEDIDQAAVERAAKIAELDAFVMRELPEGYATRVGERGVRLSGGQRQRIGIARALYHDPDVLILDEATSALDNMTERAVMDAVHNLGRAKTIVMIAHRLSTVRECDTIFMLEGGRVVAEGSYDALLASNRQFRALAGA